MYDFARDSAKLKQISNVNALVSGQHVPIWVIEEKKVVLKETHKFIIQQAYHENSSSSSSLRVSLNSTPHNRPQTFNIKKPQTITVKKPSILMVKKTPTLPVEKPAIHIVRHEKL